MLTELFQKLLLASSRPFADANSTFACLFSHCQLAHSLARFGTVSWHIRSLNPNPAHNNKTVSRIAASFQDSCSINSNPAAVFLYLVSHLLPFRPLLNLSSLLQLAIVCSVSRSKWWELLTTTKPLRHRNTRLSPSSRREPPQICLLVLTERRVRM